MISSEGHLFNQASVMKAFGLNKFHVSRLHCRRGSNSSKLKKRLRQWQEVRSWARLIREAEYLWHFDLRDLKRIGAIELTQLIEEVPYSHRKRVDRWLLKYSVATRFCSNSLPS